MIRLRWVARRKKCRSCKSYFGICGRCFGRGFYKVARLIKIQPRRGVSGGQLDIAPGRPPCKRKI